MKQWKTVAGATLLALTLSATLASAQGGVDGGGKQGKGAKGAGKAGKKQGGQAAMMGQQFKRIEDVLGKPLTDEQKTAITESFKTYQESVAKTVGMTLDEWNAKQKEYRANQRKGGKAANKPADKPADKPAQ